jgi:N-methylhydantoinase B
MRVRNLVEGRWNFEHARRSQCPPWGLWGGTAGEPGEYLLRLPKEKGFMPKIGAHIQVPRDAEAIVRTGGGGGWGDPLERDPAQVHTDVIEEFISREAARAHYGVVFKRDGSVDDKATRKARETLRARRKTGAKGRARLGAGSRR